MKIQRLLAGLCLLSLSGFGNVSNIDSDEATGQAIINRYIQASEMNSQPGKQRPLEVEIEANVPKLNEHGHLTALRKISDVGKITYRVLGFQGDNNVKNQVIARYLQAEQQGQGDKSLTLTPDNYKFKLRGQKVAYQGTYIYVFQVSPRKKRIGLFRGEVWLDSKTFLPVMEKGRLVKNPSVFFRKVDFERDFAIVNGAAVPAYMHSVIDTRLVGKVDLSVAYTSPAPSDTDAEIAEDAVNPINN